MIPTQEQHDALVKLAETAAKDIKGDHPEMDVSYDLYIEQINWPKNCRYCTTGSCWYCRSLGRPNRPPKRLVGVIDMGDAWQVVCDWHDDFWEMAPDDAYPIIEQILAVRRSSGW